MTYQVFLLGKDATTDNSYADRCHDVQKPNLGIIKFSNVRLIAIRRC